MRSWCTRFFIRKSAEMAKGSPGASAKHSASTSAFLGRRASSLGTPNINLSVEK
jgi:hypothetical protein